MLCLLVKAERDVIPDLRFLGLVKIKVSCCSVNANLHHSGSGRIA